MILASQGASGSAGGSGQWLGLIDINRFVSRRSNRDWPADYDAIGGIVNAMLGQISDEEQAARLVQVGIGVLLDQDGMLGLSDQREHFFGMATAIVSKLVAAPGPFVAVDGEAVRQRRLDLALLKSASIRSDR